MEPLIREFNLVIDQLISYMSANSDLQDISDEIKNKIRLMRSTKGESLILEQVALSMLPYASKISSRDEDFLKTDALLQDPALAYGYKFFNKIRYSYFYSSKAEQDAIYKSVVKLLSICARFEILNCD